MKYYYGGDEIRCMEVTKMAKNKDHKKEKVEKKKAEVPGALSNQNLGHNSKKVGLGQNTAR